MTFLNFGDPRKKSKDKGNTGPPNSLFSHVVFLNYIRIEGDALDIDTIHLDQLSHSIWCATLTNSVIVRSVVDLHHTDIIADNLIDIEMDYVQDLSSPLRIRSRMGIFLWSFQLFAAAAFLMLDVAFRISVYFVLVPGALIRYVFGLKERVKPKPTEAQLDLDRSFVEFVESRGFVVQEYTVQTQDGYLLTLHRILPKNYREEYNGNYQALHENLAGIGSFNANGDRKSKAYLAVPSRGVVFFQHGFLQSSECWVFRKDNDQVLPFNLASQGYDCWFGNVRGNKYSMKHTSLSPTNTPFWNYCIDDIALKDLPAMIDFVLKNTGAEQLSYVGFSQGTAIAFAAFSRYPELAAKIRVFVALGPAACVKVAAVSTSRPQFIFLLFGKKALLNTAMFWRKVVPTNMFVWIIDAALAFLFNWKTHNMDHNEKALMYYHLYSTCSVKCVVHWFQITHSGRFQMYDDNIAVVNHSHRYKAYLLPRYDIRQIQCPMAIFWGGQDTVPNHEYFLENLKDKAEFYKLDTYEHLDFLYSKNARKEVYEDVIQIINGGCKEKC
ncbi:hypothetical protein PROFUN_07583 [Planoprotostelium fungivorum]|uniref:AB hydrolase-1 domain-containing protein n=1 Tax=Planoprotostelium fungivorum TaxID=1890364 RepID=A0A2P6NLX1_9EUKA|nr:hypothetical protein PROFUN_07583 [Planoprotostelium fungivorum]